MTAKQNLAFLALKTAVDSKTGMYRRWKVMVCDPQTKWTKGQRLARFNRREKQFHANRAIISAAEKLVDSMTGQNERKKS